MAEQTLKLNVTANVTQAKNALNEIKASIRELSSAATSVPNAVGKAMSSMTSQLGNIRKQSRSIKSELSSVTNAAKETQKATNNIAPKGRIGEANLGGGSATPTISKQAKMAAKESLAYERQLYAAHNAGIKETATATRAAVKETSAWQKVSAAAAQSGFGFGSSLGHLINQFKRIAVYRVFKSILKGITDSFKIGTQNLVQYSAAMNGLDAAAANPTMSTLATQLLYVRNSVAAAAMPALQALVPVISTVANWFVAAANAVNQFISAIQGKATFTKAKEYAVDYAESIGGIGSAAGKAAKQMQQLMDFDEINNIISPKDSGGGGGGGAASGQDATQMFEEAVIGERFQKIADFVKGLKDDFDWIWNIVKVIGAGLLAWKFTAGFINTLNSLLALQGAKALGAGIILSIAGIMLGYEGGRLLASGETLAGVLTSAFGVLASGVGGYLLGTALGIGGWTIAVPMMIAVGISIALGYRKQKFAQSELGKYLQSIKDECQNIVDDTTELIESLRDEVGKLDEIGRKGDVARGLVDALFEITSKGKLTRSELSKVKALVNQINALELGDLKVEYNELTGEVSMTKDEIYKVIAAYEKQAKAAAYMSLLQKATETQIQLELEHERAVEQYNAAKTEAMKVDKEFTDFKNKYGIAALVAEGGKYWELKQRVSETHDAYDAAKDAVKATKDGMDEAQRTVTKLADGMAALESDTSEATGAVKDFTKAAKDASGKNISFEVSTSGVGDAVKRLSELRSVIKDLGNTNNLRVTTEAKSNPTKVYANGGFPTQGSLFLAGETAGQTEWLGNVNGKTGVVSGNEITGIAEAIYAASERETRTLGGLLRTIAQKELTITPSASLGRVNAQSAAMYGRVTGA